jgi:hypothetical protein
MTCSRVLKSPISTDRFCSSLGQSPSEVHVHFRVVLLFLKLSLGSVHTDPALGTLSGLDQKVTQWVESFAL